MAWYNKLKDFGDWMAGNESIQQGADEAKEVLNKVDTTSTSATDLFNKGKVMAGQAATEKAAIAKKQAKAAAGMSGAGRLTSALSAAGAASDAAANAFTDTAMQGASLQQAQEANEKNRELSKAQAKANIAAQTGQAKAEARGRARSDSMALTSSLFNSRRDD